MFSAEADTRIDADRNMNQLSGLLTLAVGLTLLSVMLPLVGIWQPWADGGCCMYHDSYKKGAKAGMAEAAGGCLRAGAACVCRRSLAAR